MPAVSERVARLQAKVFGESGRWDSSSDQTQARAPPVAHQDSDWTVVASPPTSPRPIARQAMSPTASSYGQSSFVSRQPTRGVVSPPGSLRPMSRQPLSPTASSSSSSSFVRRGGAAAPRRKRQGRVVVSANGALISSDSEQDDGTPLRGRRKGQGVVVSANGALISSDSEQDDDGAAAASSSIMRLRGRRVVGHVPMVQTPPRPRPRPQPRQGRSLAANGAIISSDSDMDDAPALPSGRNGRRRKRLNLGGGSLAANGAFISSDSDVDVAAPAWPTSPRSGVSQSPQPYFSPPTSPRSPRPGARLLISPPTSPRQTPRRHLTPGAARRQPLMSPSSWKSNLPPPPRRPLPARPQRPTPRAAAPTRQPPPPPLPPPPPRRPPPPSSPVAQPQRRSVSGTVHAEANGTYISSDSQAEFSDDGGVVAGTTPSLGARRRQPNNFRGGYVPPPSSPPPQLRANGPPVRLPRRRVPMSGGAGRGLRSSPSSSSSSKGKTPRQGRRGRERERYATAAVALPSLPSESAAVAMLRSALASGDGPELLRAYETCMRDKAGDDDDERENLGGRNQARSPKRRTKTKKIRLGPVAEALLNRVQKALYVLDKKGAAKTKLSSQDLAKGVRSQDLQDGLHWDPNTTVSGSGSGSANYPPTPHNSTGTSSGTSNTSQAQVSAAQLEQETAAWEKARVATDKREAAQERQAERAARKRAKRMARIYWDPDGAHARQLDALALGLGVVVYGLLLWRGASWLTGLFLGPAASLLASFGTSWRKRQLWREHSGLMGHQFDALHDEIGALTLAIGTETHAHDHICGHDIAAPLLLPNRVPSRRLRHRFWIEAVVANRHVVYDRCRALAGMSEVEIEGLTTSSLDARGMGSIDIPERICDKCAAARAKRKSRSSRRNRGQPGSIKKRGPGGLFGPRRNRNKMKLA